MEKITSNGCQDKEWRKGGDYSLEIFHLNEAYKDPSPNLKYFNEWTAWRGFFHLAFKYIKAGMGTRYRSWRSEGCWSAWQSRECPVVVMRAQLTQVTLLSVCITISAGTHNEDYESQPASQWDCNVVIWHQDQYYSAQSQSQGYCSIFLISDPDLYFSQL